MTNMVLVRLAKINFYILRLVRFEADGYTLQRKFVHLFLCAGIRINNLERRQPALMLPTKRIEEAIQLARGISCVGINLTSRMLKNSKTHQAIKTSITILSDLIQTLFSIDSRLSSLPSCRNPGTLRINHFTSVPTLKQRQTHHQKGSY